MEACTYLSNRPARSGYVLVKRAGRQVYAHRLAYEQAIGPIPAGLVIDHLCRTKACVTPAHLEAVTNAENVRRERRARPLKTACRHGHPYDAGNTYTDAKRPTVRACRACRRAAVERYQRAG